MYSSHLVPSTRSTALPSFSLPSEALTLEGLFAPQPAEKLAAGEAVFWEGDVASHLFQIAEGCLRLYSILPDGRRAIMGFRFAGEVLGISSQDAYLYTAEAVTPVRLRRLSRSRLHAIEEGTDQLRPLLLAKVFEEMGAAQRHIIVLGQLGAEERVAHFLVSAARRTGADRSRPIGIELPMTRLDIADYLGLTIETVCRVFSKLKRNGLISLDGRHRVVLRRLRDLQELAGAMDDNETAGQRVMAQHPAAWPH
jgi:CRP/FNR family transcriptional regulator